MPASRKSALSRWTAETAERVIEYWLEHYTAESLCALCNNTGWLRPAHGGQFYCICPNGQTMRKFQVDPDTNTAKKETE